MFDDFSRFTSFIAERAKSVVAVDFMESFIKKNEEDNSKFKNVTFKQSDVTKLRQKESRYSFMYTLSCDLYFTHQL